MCIGKIIKNIYDIIKKLSNKFENENEYENENKNDILDINNNISIKINKSSKISNSVKVNNNINNLKEKVEIIVNNSLKNYKSNNYTFNTTINEIECYIALNLLEELYSIVKKENYDICDDIIRNIIIGIKYILNHLSKNKNIDLLDNNELKDLLYNMIIDIIDDSSDILKKIL
jgi:hypothetical protein